MRIHAEPLRLEFAPQEATLLQALLTELQTVVADEAPAGADDAVRQRLFPSAYPDDADAEAEYRELTEATLRGERAERISACDGELAADRTVTLSDDDAARRWLQVLNDLRLALGTRLGVTEEPPELEPDDPQVESWLIYDWLTALQDAVVQCLMR